MVGSSSTLTVKLLRDVWRLRAQALAIALIVAAGVGIVIMSMGMMRSLEETRLAYYDRYNFADIFAPVQRAPESTLSQVRDIPGIAVAESRLSAFATLDVRGIEEPVMARIHSVPMRGEPRLNGLVLRSGRWLDPLRADEVMISEQFANAVKLAPGDMLTTLVRGKKLQLRIAATVLSPEYIYAIGPGQIFPDNRRFGVIWMARDTLAGILDMDGAFNDASILVQRGADEGEVIRRLDLLLERYGGIAAYGRDQQISDRFVLNELEELEIMTSFLPPIFLGVAAFLLNIVLARLVETEREVIGLMKAFGYRDWKIGLHYAQLALLLSVLGLILGAALGTWLGKGLATIYQQFYVFPFLHFRSDIDIYLIAGLVALGAVMLGSITAVRRALRLTPAEAMRPPTPPNYRGLVARLITRAKQLDEPTRIILRDLARQPVRSGLTVVGISFAIALYITSASATDNVDRMIDLAFDQAERQDLTVTFAELRDARALHELARLPGVRRVEPSRGVAARLRSGNRVERQGISGAVAEAQLSRVVDLDGRVIVPPENGLLISASLGRKLDIERGSTIDIEISEGRQAKLQLQVAGIVESPIGSPAFLSLGGLNRLLREGLTISGATLAIDENAESQIYARLKDSPMVAGVTSRNAALTAIRDTIARNMGIVTLFNSAFAMMIIFGVVYNSGRIMLSERARDLASLRVLGYRKNEVAYVLLGALAVLALLALPLGALLGVGLARLLMAQFGNDLYTLPFGMRGATIAEGMIVAIIATSITALLIKWRVDRLDLVDVLKTRE